MSTPEQNQVEIKALRKIALDIADRLQTLDHHISQRILSVENRLEEINKRHDANDEYEVGNHWHRLNVLLKIKDAKKLSNPDTEKI